jgi:hypothetical protein
MTETAHQFSRQLTNFRWYPPCVPTPVEASMADELDRTNPDEEMGRSDEEVRDQIDGDDEFEDVEEDDSEDDEEEDDDMES